MSKPATARTDDRTVDSELHLCEGKDEGNIYSPSTTYCYETAEGYLWAGGHNYESGVNYCPFCGFKAKKASLEVK